MLMLNSEVVFYQNMTEVPHIIHLHTFRTGWNSPYEMCGQFANICRICYTTDHT